MPLAVFRADAGVGIGAGHVMRCATLAGALAAEGWQAALAVRARPAGTLPQAAASMDRLDLDDVADDEAAEAEAMARRWPQGCDLLVVDHYGRGEGLESRCRPWTRRVMAIDDLADRRHDCDILLDQTPGREAAAYAGTVPAGARLLLGAAHALLRPAFAERRERRRRPPRQPSILVTLGATDSRNATGLALDALDRARCRWPVDVVLGPGAPHRGAAAARAAGSEGRIRLHEDVPDMAGLMADASLAIGAGGVGALERAVLGLPCLMIRTAENQRFVAAAFARAGAAVDLGAREALDADRLAAAIDALADDGDRRAAISAAALALCDGLGAARTAIALGPAARDRSGAAVDLRPARTADAGTILAWQRAPRTRRHFRNPEPPGEAEHAGWMAARLADPACRLNIILADGEPAGVLRLDRRPEEPAGRAFEVSILVAPGRTGRGIARIALDLAHRLLRGAAFHAQVHPGNRASLALFRGAGYRPQGEWLVRPAGACPHGAAA